MYVHQIFIEEIIVHFCKPRGVIYFKWKREWHVRIFNQKYDVILHYISNSQEPKIQVSFSHHFASIISGERPQALQVIFLFY